MACPGAPASREFGKPDKPPLFTILSQRAVPQSGPRVLGPGGPRARSHVRSQSCHLESGVGPPVPARWGPVEKHLPAVPEGGDKTQPKPGPEKEQDRERGSGRPAGPGSWPAARLSRDPKAREGRPSHGPGCSRPGPHLALLPGAGRRARGAEAADAPTPAPRLAGIWSPADRRVPGARAAAPAPSARRPRLSPPGPPAPALALTCRRCSVPAPPQPPPEWPRGRGRDPAARAGAAERPQAPPAGRPGPGPRAPRPGRRATPTLRPLWGPVCHRPARFSAEKAANAQTSHRRRRRRRPPPRARGSDRPGPLGA